jgi:Double zinc ribbon
MALSCSKCGKELPDNAKFCGDCGTFVEVQEKKPDYCANCFAELPEGVKFCVQCGKPAVIAQPNSPRPEKNKAIYEELEIASAKQEKYRERQAVYEATGEYPTRDERIEDFEQNRAILADRAIKWAEYETSDLVERIHWFQNFSSNSYIPWYVWSAFAKEGTLWFPTNKPNHHKALFHEEFINNYLYNLQKQGVLTWHDPPQPTPLFFDYLRNVEGWTDEDITEFKYKPPDMEEIRGWATKDDELFPLPQPLREEVAGAILNFMTDEGVLVVYMDCSLSGKRVEIDIDEPYIWSAYGFDHCRAEILERSGSGTPICAAIFNRIPFAPDMLKNQQKVLKQTQVTAKFSSPDNQKWEDKVTLFPGKVAELDWRWRTPQPKVQPQPTTTPATPSNMATLQGATITLKDVKHNADECVYFLEVVDPDYIDGAYEEKWVLRLEDSTMPDTSTAASSSYGIAGYGFASSGSELIPLPENRSKTQQKPKKVISSNFRKPQ